MSSDNEEDADLNYGINDDYDKSFGQKNNQDADEDEDENKKNLDFSATENSTEKECCVPKYEKNPKLKPVSEDESDKNDDENNQDCDLEDLMNLLEQDNEEENEEENRKKIYIRKEKPLISSQIVNEDSIKTAIQSPAPAESKIKSSITITRVPRQKENPVSNNNESSYSEENILKEKQTGIRLIKSSFKNEIDLNMRLACDHGKFLKLTDVNRRSHELKEAKDFKWFSIFLLQSKTDSKCSANGNNYVIWKLVDINNLDKQQDISLFLFGNAYKSHWKSNEFEVFALIQPDILENKSGNQQTSSNSNNNTNSYYNNSSPYGGSGKKSLLKNSNWNKFASNKIDLNNKLTLSVKSDHQLLPLGYSKDITSCQSYKNNNETNQISGENSKRCKNLVNLQEAPFCIYHCKQHESKNKFGDGITKGKYSMNEPTNRLGTKTLFESSIKSPADVTFLPNNDILRNKLMMKCAEMETKAKVSKEIKAEILNSLNSSIKDSPIMAQIGIKTSKKSDQELLASLDGKELNKEEIKKIRLAEQASVRHYSSTDNKAQKEVSKLFNSKILLPSETTCNNTISSKKIHEYKQSQTKALSSDQNGGIIKLSPFDYSAKLKEKYEENKKNYNLSSMDSHKDILKKIKDKSKDKPAAEAEKPVAAPTQLTPRVNNSIIASDFLAKCMSEIKKNSSTPKPPEKKADIGFDLELYIGDSLTTKKLLDVNSKYIPFSPSTATSNGYKRKLEELKKNDSSPSSTNHKPSCETPEDKRAKKLKMIDEILSIKSNHLKEVNDPDKNPHLKNYFNKLELQENVDNKLCSIRNREIRAVTCKSCNYTSFTQSDYCKKQNHAVNRHMALQRYFKCKICNKRTYTIDKICPVSACSQCGNEKFEPCSMKIEDTSISKLSNSSLNQESESFLESN